MNKIFKMTGVLILAVVFVFGLANLGHSSTVLDPDNETHKITSSASVEVIAGTLTETERYHVEKNADNANAIPSEDYAVLDYEENLRAVRSDATLNKNFKAHTGEAPNIVVDKNISSSAYEGGNTTNTEKIGLIRVQPDDADVGWCTHCPAGVEEACEAVAMGSSVNAEQVAISTTHSEATVIGDPDMDVPSVDHEIKAHVISMTGVPASVTASMRADFMEGPFDPTTSRPTTREFYEQHTTGSGVEVIFDKKMKYQSVVKKAMLPMPWDRLGF